MGLYKGERASSGTLLGRRYVGTMKKGSPAVDTVRDAAGALWGKGAAVAWKLPAGAAHLPATGAQPPTPAAADNQQIV